MGGPVAWVLVRCSKKSSP